MILKLALTKEFYNDDNVHFQARPLPDLCKFMSVSEITALGKDDEKCAMMEKWLKDTRQLCEEKLFASSSVARSRDVLNAWESQVIRLGASKAMLSVFPPGVAGKLSEDKLATMRSAWMLRVTKVF